MRAPAAEATTESRGCRAAAASRMPGVPQVQAPCADPANVASTPAPVPADADTVGSVATAPRPRLLQRWDLLVPVLGGGVLLAIAPIGLLSDAQRFAVGNVAEAVAALFAGVAALGEGHSPQIRRSWRLLGAAALSWGASQAVWDYAVLVRHAPPPVAVDLGFVVAVLFGLAGLLTVPLASFARRWSRMRLVVEGAMIAIAGFMFMWVVLLAPVVESGHLAVGELMRTALRPVGDVLLVALVAFVARNGASRQVSMPRLGAGLVVIAGADFAFAYLDLHDLSSGVLDAAYVIGWLLVAAAALRDRGAEAVEQAPVDINTDVLWQLRPYLIGIIGALAGLWQLYASPRPDRVVIVTVVVMALLILLHQIPVLQENVALTRYLVAQVDIRDRQVAYHEAHDLLTGLPNRDQLLAGLARAVEPPGPAAERFAGLLALRLDELAAVRESLGDSVGDKLVVAAASRLVGELRPCDLLARTGDGEFAVLLDPEVEEPSLLRLAERLRNLFRTPLLGPERPLSSTVSIAVVSEADDRSAEDLLRDARVALEEGRDRGTGQVTVFQPIMQAAAAERFALSRDLEQALAAETLSVHFQPVVETRTGAVMAAEALARWRHPVHGFVPPGRFIPLAESRGLIVALGGFVLKESLRQAARWPRGPGGAAAKVTVNLSVHQLRWPDLVGSVAALLEESGVLPSRVVFEITESVLAEDLDASLAVLHRLKALGVLLALDDFGTGYSSLSYLQRFPVDTVKIDQSFVVGLDRDSRRRALTRAIVSLCSELGFSTVAEGVERPEELTVLQELGCTGVQGYLTARPMDADALTDWMRQRPVAAPAAAGTRRTA